MLSIALVVKFRVKITGRGPLAGADPTVYGQESTGWEAEASNCGLLAGSRDLRIGVGNLFEMGLEAADSGQSAGLYGFGL
jgi:hypothetical protein